MRRALAMAMVALLAALLGPPPLAHAQGGEQQGVPEELWREYPLRDQGTAPEPSPRESREGPGAEEPPDRAEGEAASGDDSGGGSGAILPVIGLAVLAIAVAAGLGVGLPRARRRRQASAAGGGGERDRKRRARTVRPAAAKPAAGKNPQTAAKPSPGKALEPAAKPAPKRAPAKAPEPAAKPAPAKAPEPAAKSAPGKTPEPAPAKAPEPAAKLAPAKPPPPPLEPDRSLRAGPPRTIAPGGLPPAPKAPSDPGKGTRLAAPEPTTARQSAKSRPQRAAADRSSGYALGYTTVAEDEKAESPRMQQEAHQIRRACRERGLVLRKLVRDVDSPSRPDLERPGLLYTLERLDDRTCSCLVVTRLDRLTRSAANLGTLIEALEKRGARLVVTEIGLDTASREGLLAARALVKVGKLEQQKLEHQTRKGLAAARGGGSSRPAVADRPDLERRIASMRAGGMTLQAIADTLNKEGVPTLRGGAEWRPSSVQAAAGYKRPARKSRAGPDNGHGPGS